MSWGWNGSKPLSMTGDSRIQDSIVIHNVKFSVKLKQGRFNFLNSYKQRNFIVVRGKYTYVIFKPNKEGVHHINITKVPSLEQVSSSVQHLRSMIIEGELSQPRIDNLTATLNLQQTLNLYSLYDSMKQDFRNIRFCPWKFPALFWRQTCGTLYFFASGKVNLVGFKTPEQLNDACRQCLAVMKKY